jgi:hypothetical protein
MNHETIMFVIGAGIGSFLACVGIILWDCHKIHQRILKLREERE